MKYQIVVLVSISVFAASAHVHAESIELQCIIEIVKEFSLPGPPRRYTDDARVEIEETPEFKKLKVTSINLIKFVDTSPFYRERGWTAVDKSTSSAWNISFSTSKPINSGPDIDQTQIIIDRLSGRIAISAYSGTPTDWLKTSATGTCTKADLSKLKF